MEYKPLQFLENTYPNPDNYVPTGVEKTTLKGLYPEKNKIDFSLPSISELKYVDGTEFKFVLAIFKDYKDTKPVYYTSEQYYYTLQNSILEGNPYFSQASFSPQNIVSYVIESPLKVYAPLHKEEIKPRVNVRQNIFINTGSFVDYDNLVTYIDWMVSQVSPLDDDNFGVLKAETIAGWDVLNGNYATGEISTGVSASFGIGAEFVLITETEGNDLKFQQQKLDRLKKEIENLQKVINTKNGFVYNTSGPFYSTAFVIVNEKMYSTSSNLKRNKSDKTQQLVQTLTTELNNLQKEISNTESTIVDINKSLSDSAKAAADKAKALLGQATNLLGKIPKIPKLPAIPQIPKLPSLSDIGAGLLSALPVLPALPKLPKIKLPKFSFPALPKLKKKEPKQPKKFKNKAKAGLDGLKDAANSAQGAVAGVQSAAAGAMSSAQGAIAGAQSAAAGVQSASQGAIANAQSIVAGAQSTAMNTLGNINKGIITNVSNIGGGTLTTKTITSAILGKGETEASILADIAKAAAEAAAHIKK